MHFRIIYVYIYTPSWSSGRWTHMPGIISLFICVYNLFIFPVFLLSLQLLGLPYSKACMPPMSLKLWSCQPLHTGHQHRMVTLFLWSPTHSPLSPLSYLTGVFSAHSTHSPCPHQPQPQTSEPFPHLVEKM